MMWWAPKDATHYCDYALPTGQKDPRTLTLRRCSFGYLVSLCDNVGIAYAGEFS